MRNHLESQLLKQGSPANHVLMDSLQTSTNTPNSKRSWNTLTAESRLAALKDELHLANKRASRIPDLKPSLQNCRRKLEDFSDVKKQLRAAQEEIEGLRKENQMLREEGESGVVRQIAPLREELH